MGLDFSFGLSQGLFSSADIDSGTRFLLKVFSRILDEDIANHKTLPRQVLDSGCGVGVIGICAAKAIEAAGGKAEIRCQDRDELGCVLTTYNAEINRIPSTALQAFTEPLLAGEPLPAETENTHWDLILSNIPAKAGAPVLEDFISRSAGLLNPGGRIIIVVVHTLADFFRQRITDTGSQIELEEKSPMHHVFVYGRGREAEPVKAGAGFIANNPFYHRDTVDCEIEEIPLHIETVYGAPEFDGPSASTLAAAKLIRRLGTEKLSAGNSLGENAGNKKRILVHEPGQGFFPCFLLEFFKREFSLSSHFQNNANVESYRLPELILSGRNILALEACRKNCNFGTIVPIPDLILGTDTLLQTATGDIPQADAESPVQNTARQYNLIITFPILLPQSSLAKETDQLSAIWEAIRLLLAVDGIFIACFNSTDAERFDKRKPKGFIRFGDIKRKGFRALAYKKMRSEE